MEWHSQVVLVTGGTGSFGRKFTEIMLREYHPKKLIILSRDELKQHEMRQMYLASVKGAVQRLLKSAEPRREMSTAGRRLGVKQGAVRVAEVIDSMRRGG